MSLFGRDPDRDLIARERIGRLGEIGGRSGAFVLPHPEPERVERRHHQQGQDGGDEQPAHDGDRHRAPKNAARQRV